MLSLKKIKIKGISNQLYVTSAIVAFALLSGVGTYMFKDFTKKNNLKKANESVVQILHVAQGYSDLNGKFNFDPNSMLAVATKTYLRGDSQGPYKSGFSVGASTLGSNPNHEFFVTIKSVPVSVCADLTGMFNQNFDVIAIGKSSNENIGTNTGMYVKNVYGNRVYNQEFVKETCLKEAGAIGLVNITTWVTKNNQLKLNGETVEKYNQQKN